MDEFIVWDKKFDRFLPEEDIAISSLGFIFELNEDGYFPKNVKDFTIHKAIGKTDIEGSKIYADSSIVEFEFFHNEAVPSLSKCLKGYFTYIDKILAFNIKVIGDEISSLNYSHFSRRTINLKIIGTLQENPELLKDN